MLRAEHATAGDLRPRGAQLIERQPRTARRLERKSAPTGAPSAARALGMVAPPIDAVRTTGCRVAQRAPAATPARARPRRRLRLLLACMRHGARRCSLARWRAHVQVQCRRPRAFASPRADQQRTTIRCTRPRGEIVDRRGRALAVSRAGRHDRRLPALIDRRRRSRAVARPIADVTGQDARAAARRPQLRYVEVAAQLDLVGQADPEAADGAEATRTPRRSTFTPEERRVYPSGVAAQVVGIVDIESRASPGVEHALRRRAARARRAARSTCATRRATPSPSCSLAAGAPGETLRADARPRHPGVARAGARGDARDWKAKGVTAVVLDPRTGGVLAMASAPRACRRAATARRRPTSSASARSPTSTSPARRSRP